MSGNDTVTAKMANRFQKKLAKQQTIMSNKTTTTLIIIVFSGANSSQKTSTRVYDKGCMV